MGERGQPHRVLNRRQVLQMAPALVLLAPRPGSGRHFDVRRFGAAGDGTTIDTGPINQAIAAAAAAGGGTVAFPPGIYASYSIRLRSRITLALGPGATLLAGVPDRSRGQGYDAPGPTGPWAAYQDFGHNHWRNSLISGEGLEDIAILGPGIIRGSGLSRGLGPEPGLPRPDAPGAGDKAIALKNCRNVLLRDLNILDGGHIGFLATGVDDLTIENLTIDTDRDGMDIDCCRNVSIRDCRVNSPWDDAIALKSSFALGILRLTENVTISHCTVSGSYRLGALLDGSFRHFAANRVPYRDAPVGRLKLGTESVGGFRNIAISNCVFEGCRGLAIECVDGGVTENITIQGLRMRGIGNAPFFLRLGARMRGPKGRPVGRMRGVRISDVVCDGDRDQMPAIISGIPGHPVEDIVLSHIRFLAEGGGTAAMARILPPEETGRYPEPAAFGRLPAQGFFIRHARNVVVRDVTIQTRRRDARPFVWLGHVNGVEVAGLRLGKEVEAPSFLLNHVSDFRASHCSRLAATTIASATHRVLP